MIVTDLRATADAHAAEPEPSKGHRCNACAQDATLTVYWCAECLLKDVGVPSASEEPNRWEQCGGVLASPTTERERLAERLSDDAEMLDLNCVDSVLAKQIATRLMAAVALLRAPTWGREELARALAATFSDATGGGPWSDDEEYGAHASREYWRSRADFILARLEGRDSK